MKQSIKDYENLLSVFSYLRKYDLIPNKYIIDWTDQILASEQESGYEFIEISTAKNTHDLLKYLDKNSGDADMEIVCRSILGIIYNLFYNQESEFRTIFKITKDISYEESLTADEQWLLYGFGDYSLYDLEGTYAAYRLVKEDFLEFLSIYKSFTLENYQEWSEINDHLKMGLDDKLEKVKNNFPY